MPALITEALQRKVLSFGESSYGAYRVSLLLSDGRVVPNVVLARGDEIVRVGPRDVTGGGDLGFRVEDVVDVLRGTTPIPGERDSLVSETGDSSELDAISGWFVERGFALGFSQADGTIAVDLTRIPGGAVVARYGQGDSRLAAARSAKQRFEWEQ